jgi:L-threonine kinase
VTVHLCPQPQILVPAGWVKTQQAARLALDYLGWPDLGATVSLSSQLLPGRGMASSTADVVGVMAGLAQMLGQPLTSAELARLSCQIEPSDSTMFARLALLAYRGSSRYHELGLAPALPLLMLDPGYIVDTLSFNAQLNLVAVRHLASATQTALDLLRQGLRDHAPEAIGAAATLSAMSYQMVSYNPLLEQAHNWAEATGAVGLVRAHSGSVIGLLYSAKTNLAEPARWLTKRFDGAITPTQLSDGGYRLEAEGVDLSLTFEKKMIRSDDFSCSRP